MEVRINSEIRKYSETIFFGLTLRQFISSILAVGIAVLVYFSLRDMFTIDIIGWICMVCAVPFAFVGFFRYHGLPLERVCVYFFRSQVTTPGELPWGGGNGFIRNFYEREARENQKNNAKKGANKKMKEGDTVNV